MSIGLLSEILGQLGFRRWIECGVAIEFAVKVVERLVGALGKGGELLKGFDLAVLLITARDIHVTEHFWYVFVGMPGYSTLANEDTELVERVCGSRVQCVTQLFLRAVVVTVEVRSQFVFVLRHPFVERDILVLSTVLRGIPHLSVA